MIEDGVVFAAGHESEASEIGENGPRAILTIEPEQRVCWWKLVRGEIPTNGRKALTQFLSVATVAAIAKRAELCGIKTDMSRVIELAHPFPLGFLLSAVFPVQPSAF